MISRALIAPTTIPALLLTEALGELLYAQLPSGPITFHVAVEPVDTPLSEPVALPLLAIVVGARRNNGKT